MNLADFNRYAEDLRPKATSVLNYNMTNSFFTGRMAGNALQQPSPMLNMLRQQQSQQIVGSTAVGLDDIAGIIPIFGGRK